MTSSDLCSSDFCFGPAEDMVGFFPWWDGGRWDIGNPRREPASQLNFATPQSLVHSIDPWNAFLAILWKSLISTNNICLCSSQNINGKPHMSLTPGALNITQLIVQCQPIEYYSFLSILCLCGGGKFYLIYLFICSSIQ